MALALNHPLQSKSKKLGEKKKNPKLLELHQKAVGVVSDSIAGPNPAALLTLFTAGEVWAQAGSPGSWGFAPVCTERRSWDLRAESGQQLLPVLAMLYCWAGTERFPRLNPAPFPWQLSTRVQPLRPRASQGYDCFKAINCYVVLPSPTHQTKLRESTQG